MFFINLDWFCSMDTTHPCTTLGCGINQQWPFKGNHFGTQLKLVLAFLGGCFQMSTGCTVTERENSPLGYYYQTSSSEDLHEFQPAHWPLEPQN